MNLREFGRYAAYTVFAMAMVSLTFAAGWVARGEFGTPSDERYPLLAEAQRHLDRSFLGEVPDETTRSYGLIRGLVDTYNDRYTFFVEPVQARLDSDDLAGTYGGIGSYLTRNEDGELALEPFEDSPAAEAGILIGDILLRVDDTEITPEMSLDEIVSIVRGPEGSTVRLQVRTGDNAPRELDVTRREIPLPSVSHRVLEQDDTIGLIRMTRFADTSADEVEAAIEDLRSQGVDKLVIDLRNNGGGLLTAATDTADLFLEEGVILYEEDVDTGEQTYRARSGGAATDLPIVILINELTASASEILAGALRENGRAVLIGQNSFGKTSVQLIHALSDGSSLHVTHARWYTPDRTNIEDGGLAPDIFLEFDADAHGQGLDPELERAVEYLQNTAATADTGED